MQSPVHSPPVSSPRTMPHAPNDTDVVGVAAFISAFVVGVESMRRLLKLLRRLSQQADAFLGSPGGNGIPAVPGILERVRDIELHDVARDVKLEKLESLSEQITDLQGQLVVIQRQMAEMLQTNQATE